MKLRRAILLAAMGWGAVVASGEDAPTPPAAPPPAAPSTPPAPAGPIQVTLKTDLPEYRHGIPGVKYIMAPTGNMIATLTVKNVSDKPQELVFANGQKYDFSIKNEKGEVVKRWAEGKKFAEVGQTVTLKPGEQMSFNETVPLGAVARPLPVGNYTVEGVLMTMPAQKANAAFKIIETDSPPKVTVTNGK